MIGAQRVAYGVSTIAALLLCRNHLTDPADVDAGLALLARTLGALGLGVAAAAVVTPIAVHRMGTTRWIVLVLFGSAGLELLLAAAMGPTVLVLAAFGLGVGAQGIKICVDSLVQEDVDDESRQ